MSKRIYAINEELETHETDSRITFKAQCPECGEQFRVAESQWWEPRCDCGYIWCLEINIYTEKE